MAEATGLFESHGIEDLVGMLYEHLDDNSVGEDHWIFDEDISGFIWAAYYAPEQFAEGVWNLNFIGVHLSNQGQNAVWPYYVMWRKRC